MVYTRTRNNVHASTCLSSPATIAKAANEDDKRESPIGKQTSKTTRERFLQATPKTFHYEKFSICFYQSFLLIGLICNGRSALPE
jgi:hypothetical protein